MEAASILAIIILIIAILIMIYYYLQITNNQIYQNIHSQATGISSRVGQEEYFTNITDKMNDFSGKIKDKIQDEEDEEHISKADVISNKIDQFIDEQSEQVIADWDLVTHKDLDSIIEKYDSIEKDLNQYKQDNNNRVETIESRLDDIDKKLEEME